MTSEEITALVAKITAGVSAATICYRKVVRPMWLRAKNFIKLYDDVTFLVTEMQPNHGSTMRDAIDRIEKSQGDLRKSQLRQESLLEARQMVMNDQMDFGIMDTQPDGRVSYMNSAFSLWTGRPSNELMGHGWGNMISHAERRAVMDAWQAAVKDQRVFESQFNCVDHGGGGFVVSFRAVPMINMMDSSLFGYRAIVRRIEPVEGKHETGTQVFN